MKKVLKLIPVFVLVVVLATVAATTLAAPGVDTANSNTVLIPPSVGNLQETEPVTDTEVMTDTEVVTGTEEMTETEAVTETGVMTETEVVTETVEMAEPGVMPEAAPSALCAQDYVVQAGDTLGLIASNFLGSIGAYTEIADATNAAAAAGAGPYTAIANPNIISVGQTLCIPGPGGAAAIAGTGVVTGPQQVQVPGLTVEIPEGMAVVAVENVSAVDLVFDISGPQHDTEVIPPTGLNQFVLPPGDYNFNGHQPGGAFTLRPGEFSLAEGDFLYLSCSDSGMCVPVPAMMMAPTGTITETEAAVEEPAMAVEEEAGTTDEAEMTGETETTGEGETTGETEAAPGTE